MKSKLVILAGILALSVALAGLSLAQQPPQQEQEQPPQQEPPAQVAEPLNLVVEEAVMCTSVEGRVPQGVPTGAPAAAVTDTAAAAETKATETTTATEAAAAATTAAPTGGSTDPYPFAVGVGKLYCFTKISGATTATTVKHVWYFGDTVVHTMELSLDGTPWRTWSNKTIPASWTGTGKVEVQDATGAVLKTVSFVVQ